MTKSHAGNLLACQHMCGIRDVGQGLRLGFHAGNAARPTRMRAAAGLGVGWLRHGALARVVARVRAALAARAAGLRGRASAGVLAQHRP